MFNYFILYHRINVYFLFFGLYLIQSALIESCLVVNLRNLETFPRFISSSLSLMSSLFNIQSYCQQDYTSDSLIWQWFFFSFFFDFTNFFLWRSFWLYWIGSQIMLCKKVYSILTLCFFMKPSPPYAFFLSFKATLYKCIICITIHWWCQMPSHKTEQSITLLTILPIYVLKLNTHKWLNN